MYQTIFYHNKQVITLNVVIPLSFEQAERPIWGDLIKTALKW
jgi:hypothetical protein